MISYRVKEKIGMNWKPLGHFYVDKDILPDLDSFRHKVPSGRIAVIRNDIANGPAQVCIIGLPSLFAPRDKEFVQILATVAFYVFELKIKFDGPECVTFQFDGSEDEYMNDGVFRCRIRTGRRGGFGCRFGCWDTSFTMRLQTKEQK